MFLACSDLFLQFISKLVPAVEFSFHPFKSDQIRSIDVITFNPSMDCTDSDSDNGAMSMEVDMFSSYTDDRQQLL